MPLDPPIASLVDTLVDVLARELLAETEKTHRQAEMRVENGAGTLPVATESKKTAGLFGDSPDGSGVLLTVLSGAAKSTTPVSMQSPPEGKTG